MPLAIITLFLRCVALSFYIVGALALITLIQFVLVYHGLSAPFTQIIGVMSEREMFPAQK